MSEIERGRIRKEAADTVVSRPPRPSDERTDSALREYLGIAMFETFARAGRMLPGSQHHPPKGDAKAGS